MGRPAPRSQRTLTLRSVSSALEEFLGKRGGAEHTRLTLLWEHWAMVMGKELSSLGTPLGHKKDVLIIAAEDSMAAQDLAMQATEILERVNAFMQGPSFSRVQVELALGRNDLSRAMPPLRPRPEEYSPKRPAELGGLMEKLDPASPVTQCYRAYLRYFSRYNNTLF